MADKKTDDDLALQAYLYAGSELSPAERDAFEQRLALDQSARGALAEAVQMSASLAGKETRPNPAYRAEVRRRLRPRWWQRVLDRRAWPGHPILWAAAGAVASLLLAVTALRPAPEVRVVQVPVEKAPDSPEPADDRELGDMAFIWAELSTPDHVARTHAEENRRKTRIEDRKQHRHSAGSPAGH